jgi:DNA-binding transcriptional ArsR family regulator
LPVADGGGAEDVGSTSGKGPSPDAVFDALADPTRRRLLAEISSRGPVSATQLAAAFPVSRQAVVKHLGALSSAGVLTAERHGREVLYAVVPSRLQEATEWLDQVGRRWDERLKALVEHLSPPA